MLKFLVLPLLMLTFSAYGLVSYGPTKAGNSLWQIAKTSKPKGVTTQAMMQVIRKLNPQAFSNDNAHALRIGVSLQLPTSKQEISKLYSVWNKSKATAAPSKASKINTEVVHSTVTTKHVSAKVEQQKYSCLWILFVVFGVAVFIYNQIWRRKLSLRAMEEKGRELAAQRLGVSKDQLS